MGRTTTGAYRGRTVPKSLGDPGVAATLDLFRTGASLTRAEVAERTGWARVTVTGRLDQLLEDGLLASVEERAGRRGRPATRYSLRRDAGMLLVADVGASGMRVARCDLTGIVEETRDLPSEIGDGPATVLRTVREGWGELVGRVPGRLPWGLAISLPGPIEYPTGRVVDPPIMTGWDGYDVRAELASWHNCAVHVENDVNAMAVGEVAAAAEAGHAVADLLVVKVGTGVGAGIISGGRVLRGAVGAAGDIGHTEADVSGIREDRRQCRCGKIGCVEAYTGGWALVRDAAERGRHVDDLAGFLHLLAAGDPVIRGLTADAGRVLGSSVATAVSLVNPQQVLLGGSLGVSGEHLIAGVRERVYARSLPLATRSLHIGTSRLGHDAGIRGLAHELSRKVLTGHAD